MILNTHWSDEAACVSSPGGGDVLEDERGSVALKRLTLFIKDNCDKCPVAQECLDSSYIQPKDMLPIDDNAWTVRGGYLPTIVSIRPVGRPRGRLNSDWKPKQPPNPLPVGKRPANTSLIEWGVCGQGLHGIESFDDVIVRRSGLANQARECRGCYRDRKVKQGIEGKAKREKARIEREKNPKPPAAFCREGHAMKGDNVLIMPKGYRRCRTCKRINDKKSNAKRARMAA